MFLTKEEIISRHEIRYPDMFKNLIGQLPGFPKATRHKLIRGGIVIPGAVNKYPAADVDSWLANNDVYAEMRKINLAKYRKSSPSLDKKVIDKTGLVTLRQVAEIFEITDFNTFKNFFKQMKDSPKPVCKMNLHKGKLNMYLEHEILEYKETHDVEFEMMRANYDYVERYNKSVKPKKSIIEKPKMTLELAFMRGDFSRRAA
jgi:hypothetical protein